MICKRLTKSEGMHYAATTNQFCSYVLTEIRANFGTVHQRITLVVLVAFKWLGMAKLKKKSAES